jgi:hypothetical protein
VLANNQQSEDISNKKDISKQEDISNKEDINKEDIKQQIEKLNHKWNQALEGMEDMKQELMDVFEEFYPQAQQVFPDEL